MQLKADFVCFARRASALPLSTGQKMWRSLLYLKMGASRLSSGQCQVDFCMPMTCMTRSARISSCQWAKVNLVERHCLNFQQVIFISGWHVVGSLRINNIENATSLFLKAWLSLTRGVMGCSGTYPESPRRLFVISLLVKGSLSTYLRWQGRRPCLLESRPARVGELILGTFSKFYANTGPGKGRTDNVERWKIWRVPLSEWLSLAKLKSINVDKCGHLLICRD